MYEAAQTPRSSVLNNFDDPASASGKNFLRDTACNP